MRALLALPLAFVLDLRGCEESLPAMPDVTSTAPTAVGPHSGALVTAGGRPVELVARTDGTLEVYGLTAGPQALGTDWIVSAQVPTAGGVQRIASLFYRPEAGRYEGPLAGGPATPGTFRVGYIADGVTFVADGTLAQVLPPGPPVVAAAPAPEPVQQAQAATTADAGATEAGETAEVATAEGETPDETTATPTPTATPSPTPTATPSPTPTATPSPTPTATATPTPTPTPTATPTPTPTATAAPTAAVAPTPAASRDAAPAAAEPASTMRAATSEHRSSGSGFRSSRSRNRR